MKPSDLVQIRKRKFIEPFVFFMTQEKKNHFQL